MAFISDDIAQKMLAKVHHAVNESEGHRKDSINVEKT